MHELNYTNTTTVSADDEEQLAEIQVLYTVCECLVAVGAVAGNGLVLLAFKNERRLRRRTNYYIVSLAAADLLVGLLGIPFAIMASVGLPENLHGCLFTVSLLVMLCTISIFSLVAVSADRYWAIIYPMGYSRSVTTRTAIAIIAVCWVAGSLVGLLPLLGWHKGPSDKGCAFVEVMDYDYLVFLYFTTIIFPALLLLASYSHIFLVVRRQIRQTASMHPTPSTKLRVLGAAQRREVKAAQNLSIIVFFFIVCWIPLYTINCVKAFCPSYMPPLALTNFCIILSHLNSAVNPLLYAYHLRDFRAALRSLLCPCAGEVPNEHTVYGRNSAASTNRVNHVQHEHLQIPIEINGGFRRRSLSVGDTPVTYREHKNNEEPIKKSLESISKIICEREVHSESSAWSATIQQPKRLQGRCKSAYGLINSGYIDDPTTNAALLFTSLPPLNNHLALEILGRPSSNDSIASNDALVIKDENIIQIKRIEAEGRA